jgi:hypothetical protein
MKCPYGVILSRISFGGGKPSGEGHGVRPLDVAANAGPSHYVAGIVSESSLVSTSGCLPAGRPLCWSR